MVSQQVLLESVPRSLEEESAIPDDITYITHEPDFNSEAIKLPVIQVLRTAVTNVNETNTDFVGYNRDESDRITDELYERLYVMDLTVAIWTADGSVYDNAGLPNEVRTSLYKHDYDGPQKPFTYENGEPIDDVWRVSLTNTRENDDVTYTPTLRVHEQDLRVWAAETIESPIEQDIITEVTEDVSVN